MKNISPQPAPRQNNDRNTSPAAIASQAGVDKGRPLCKAELGLLWFSLLYGGHSKRKPRSLLRSGFFTLRLVDSNLPESLRYASAMMLRDSLSNRAGVFHSSPHRLSLRCASAMMLRIYSQTGA